jgi:hypothetical protein
MHDVRTRRLARADTVERWVIDCSATRAPNRTTESGQGPCPDSADAGRHAQGKGHRPTESARGPELLHEVVAINPTTTVHGNTLEHPKKAKAGEA